MRRLLVSLATLIPLAAVLSACGEASNSTGQSDIRFVEGSGAVTHVPVSERKPAPDLRGETLDGETFDLKALRGKVVVLNVWGSWCPPCRKEAPDLVKASKSLAGKGVEFVGINTRDTDPVPARRFVKKQGIGYPNVYDPDGRQLLGFRDNIPPSSIPSTLVIDKQGRVAARVLGASTQRTFEQLASDVAAGR